MATARTGPGAGRVRRALRWILGPPGSAFHGGLVVVASWLLWVLGLPGFAVFTVMALLFVLAAASAIWAVKVIAFVVRRRSGTTPSTVGPFLVAPVGAVIVAAVAWGGIPLQARWAVSEAAFARVVAEAGPPSTPTERADIDVPRRVGAYRILDAYRVGDAVIFVEPTGLLFDDAGFAYLPDGPFAELESGSFERPRFEHLGGPWYTWTASW